MFKSLKRWLGHKRADFLYDWRHRRSRILRPAAIGAAVGAMAMPGPWAAHVAQAPVIPQPAPAQVVVQVVDVKPWLDVKAALAAARMTQTPDQLTVTAAQANDIVNGEHAQADTVTIRAWNAMLDSKWAKKGCTAAFRKADEALLKQGEAIAIGYNVSCNGYNASYTALDPNQVVVAAQPAAEPDMKALLALAAGINQPIQVAAQQPQPDCKDVCSMPLAEMNLRGTIQQANAAIPVKPVKKLPKILNLSLPVAQKPMDLGL